MANPTSHDGSARVAPATAHPFHLVGALGGVVFAAVLGVTTLVRRDRPLHAFGHAHTAVLDVDSPAGIGVPLLDRAGRSDVLVRISRAASLSHRGPDVWGLALRIPHGRDGGDADLLFANTGTGPMGRYVLTLGSRPGAHPMTTLLPMDSPTGLVQLAVRAAAPQVWELAWSRPSDPAWRRVGALTLGAATEDPGHFHPTDHPPAGLTSPPWITALRAPAYHVARALVRLRSR